MEGKKTSAGACLWNPAAGERLLIQITPPRQSPSTNLPLIPCKKSSLKTTFQKNLKKKTKTSPSQSLFLEMGLKMRPELRELGSICFPKPTNICVIQLASRELNSTSGKHMTSLTQTCCPVLGCARVCHTISYVFLCQCVFDEHPMRSVFVLPRQLTRRQ